MSTAAEQSVLGALLIDGAAFPKVAAILNSDDFSRSDHKLIFSAIAALAAAGKPCDALTVSEQLANRLSDAGGLAYLSKLMRETPTAANVLTYANYVREHATAVNGDEAPPDNDLLPVEAYLDEESRAYGPHRERANGDQQPHVEPFAFQRLDQVETRARPAVVQGLGLDAATVAAIVGAPNAGKTAFAVSMALAIASHAAKWLGLKVAGGPVAYFAAEAPGSVKMRARAALARIEQPATATPPSLYVSEAAPAIGGELTAAVDAHRIIATIAAIKALEGKSVSAVFVDTLASCLGDGDENGDGMLRLVAAAKQIALATGACVVLLHHPSKGDAGGLRGHGSLAAACDAIIRIEMDDMTGVRTATLIKARDHATGLQLRFELDPVALPERDSFGDALTTIVVRPTDKPAPRPRPTGARQRDLLTELERRYRTGERQWDEATVCKAGRDLGMPRTSPKDALRALIKAGYLGGPASAHTLRHPPENLP